LKIEGTGDSPLASPENNESAQPSEKEKEMGMIMKMMEASHE